jgi:hypothetical protein
VRHRKRRVRPQGKDVGCGFDFEKVGVKAQLSYQLHMGRSMSDALDYGQSSNRVPTNANVFTENLEPIMAAQKIQY